MDRLAPTRRPEGPNAGTQRWLELLFLHWWVPAEVLRPLIPARLSLDLWEGRALVGMIPFRMEDVRPGWLPKVLSREFLELNLRTYVHLDGEGPGIYFFSLEAADWLAVQAARLGWGLPYFHAEMESRRCPRGEAGSTRAGDTVHYRSVRAGAPAAHLDVRYEIGAPLGPSEPGSLEHFLLERYYLYVERNGVLSRGQVHHPAYPAHAARIDSISEGLFAAAGLPDAGAVAVAHYSPGVDVELFALERV